MATENQSNRCRTCLSQSTDNKNVFSTDTEENITYNDMIMSLTTALILEDDGFPENICTFCIAELQRAYKFKKLCEKSDSALRNATDIDEDIEIKEEFTVYIKSECEDSSEVTTPTDIEVPREKVKRHKCQQCDKSFTTSYFLLNHVRIHTGERPYICQHCGKSFMRSSHLVRHIRIHTGERPYGCMTCGKRFNQSAHLSEHNLIHTGEKLAKCEVCRKKFSTGSMLARHMKIHTGEKRHKCVYCGKGFCANATLVRHVRTHTALKNTGTTSDAQGMKIKEEFTGNVKSESSVIISEIKKTHTCEFCNKTFLYMSDLKRHGIMHTNERPFVCNVCGKDFRHKKSFTIHLKIHSRS